MIRKKNRKKKSRENQLVTKLSLVKAFVATAAILVLSGLGFWRCLDEADDDASDSLEASAPARVVKVAAHQEVDPTLLNESALLSAEKPLPEARKIPPVKAPDKPVVVEEKEEAPRFPLYGVAFHFHTQLRNAPKLDAAIVGYTRRGATFRTSARLSTKGCKAGWHEIAPGGLFVCRGDGVLIDEKPVTFAPAPPAPNLDRPLPYRYAYVTRDDTPEYWRMPTPEESETVHGIFSRSAPGAPQESSIPVAAGAKAAPGEAAPEPTRSKEPAPQEGASAHDGERKETTAATQSAESPPSGKPVDATEPETNAPQTVLPSYVHLRMARGYFVSTDDIVTEGATRYQRTVRGRFIPADHLNPATSSDFSGMLINPRRPLPRVFVAGGGATLFKQLVKGNALKSYKKVARLAKLDYMGEVERQGQTYINVGNGELLSSRVATVVRAVSPPKDLQSEERWIDVSLSSQTLVAYEGTRPVFATLVSTGREGFETPTGTFRIYAKHIAITMDDTQAGAEAYSIEDVPWVQYFKDSFALHAAFWHDRFGRVRSHGCVNLAPQDARRLFFWTGPVLPEGVHGLVATPENSGTRVIVHE